MSKDRVNLSRREFLKFLGSVGLGVAITETYERLYNIPSLERRLREEVSSELERIFRSGYTLFEANFSPDNFYDFKYAIDASVGCPQIPVEIEDGKMEIVKDETSPQENGYCLQLRSNVRKNQAY
jgi:hypothetical protein